MKKPWLILIAAVVPVAAALVPLAASADARDSKPVPAGSCAVMPLSAPSGTTVEAVTAVPHAGGTVTFPAAPPLHPQEETLTDVPAWCDITVTVSHPGANDHVAIKVLLPQDRKNWNGRFQATGGSAYLAGDFGSPLVAAMKAGYVAAATDAGVGANPLDVSGWALNSAGAVNTPLLLDFASRSPHDMAVVGKDVARRFYDKPVAYAYWNGCSTGGRQGYAEAQDYPTDFDGILAKAPAINWDRFAVATLWSQAVFNEEKVAPTPCELDAFTNAAVRACDTVDGTRDGIIDNPQDCTWDARQLVGTKVICDGKEITITEATADAVNKVWAGPVSAKGERLWYGPNKGASLAALATPGAPFFVADTWVKYFVTQNPSFDTTKLTYQSFEELFRASQRQFNDLIGTDDPDLSAFAKTGGKLLSWHGQSDELVPTQGTIDYRERVDRALGGDKKVDDFYRLFLVPGAYHCVGGAGPQPTDDLGALVTWVEQGKAPETLAAATADGSVTRDICRYPMVARYTGHGDQASAASYRCVKS